MKENNIFKPMKEKKGKIELKNASNVPLLIQAILILIVFALYILTLIYKEKNLDIFLYTALALLFGFMAYNNKYRFKRKNFTLFYIVAGVLSAVVAVMSLF